MSPNSDVKDPTQLAVRLTRIESQLSNMIESSTQQQNSTSSSMMALQGEVRHIGDAVNRISAVAEMQSHDRENIKRIWERIEANERKSQLRWDQYMADQDKYREIVSDKLAANKSKVDRILFVALGISVTVGIAMTIVYDSNAQLQHANETRQQASDARINKLDDRADRIELHLAGDPKRPFQR